MCVLLREDYYYIALWYANYTVSEGINEGIG